jgi:hypothetical protein
MATRDHAAIYRRRKELAEAQGYSSLYERTAARAVYRDTHAREVAQWTELRKSHGLPGSAGVATVDLARGWHHYEGGISPLAEPARAEDFAAMRGRIARVTGRYSDEPEHSQRVRNAIMHDYVELYHDDLSDYDEDHLIWEFEGETP